MSNRYISIVLCSVFVASCGHYEWVNRSGPNTDAEFNRSSLSCQQEAARMYPYRSKTIVTEGNYVPSQPTQTNCYNYGGNVQCNTTGGGGGYREAPTYQQVDGNSGNRDEYWRTCMATKGWYRVYVDGNTKNSPTKPVTSTAVATQSNPAASQQTINDAEKIRSLRIDAEKGHPRAMNNLGVAYAEGRGGLPRDEAVAYAWYKKAADAGDAYGQLNVGHFLLNGKAGLSKDPATACGWFQKAAGEGVAPAQNNLGWCYENGIGVPRDLDTAIRWYRLAASKDNAMAAQNLKRLGK